MEVLHNRTVLGNHNYVNVSITIDRTVHGDRMHVYNIDGENLSFGFGQWEPALGYNTTDLNGNKGLVAYYSFDDNATDNMGKYNLTDSNSDAFVNYSIGIFNASYQGDGVSDYYEAADVKGISGGSAFTVSAWFKNKDGIYGTEGIIGDSFSTNEIKIYGNSAERLNCDAQLGGTIEQTFSSNGVLADTEWHHVVCKYDGTNMSLWLDGVIVDSSQIQML